MEFQFKEKTETQLKANFYKRQVANISEFKNFEDFLNWYNNKTKECTYCGISEEDVQKIVVLGLLKSKRFPLSGKTERGKARGMWLEVDRFNPNEKYSEKNCVLACYFCNNDKSDVFNGNDYIDFHQNRFDYLRKLLNK